MIDELRKNISAEIKMAGEISSLVNKQESMNFEEKKLVSEVIESLKSRIRILNNTIPSLLSEITLIKKLSPEKKSRPSEIIPVRIEKDNEILLKSSDRESYLKELNIEESLIKKIRKSKKEKIDLGEQFKKNSVYGRLSNKIFLGVVQAWIDKGYFKSLSLDIRRSNLNVLTATYISMLLFTTLFSAALSFFLFVFLLFFTISLQFPFIDAYQGAFLDRLIKVFWIVIAVPLLTFVLFYFFPSAEKSALGKRIEQELPFVVIHMASISGSGIEPAEIFRIISLSTEYKYSGKEFRKIINQTNIYGYDLSTALRNVAMATPSSRLSELLNGISITINSGGDIKGFFEKRAESLLLEYRLEREKFTKTAETFMDIYISIVIAAPMILLMLLIMISVSGLQTGLSIAEMTLAIIGVVGIINILFLAFLHLKQPTY